MLLEIELLDSKHNLRASMIQLIILVHDVINISLSSNSYPFFLFCLYVQKSNVWATENRMWLVSFSTLEVDHQKVRSSLEQINYACELHTEQLREKSGVISEMTHELEKYNEEFNVLKKELQEVRRWKSSLIYFISLICNIILDVLIWETIKTK